MEKNKIGVEEIYLAPEKELLEEEFSNKPSEEQINVDVSVVLEEERRGNTQVSEILELREKNCKVYRMSDGTGQAVFYPENIHVLNNETKRFEDVDNAIAEEEDGRYYVNGKNHFVARFSREEETDELFEIEKGIHRITISAKKNKKKRNQGVIPKVYRKNERGFGRPGMLVFDGVEEGSEYEYSVSGNGVKENIIIKEKKEVYRYPFVIHTENVTAVFNEANKRVAFVSDENGEEIFFIPAPFMTDADGIVSTAVSYELKSSSNGDTIFTVTADSQWINAEQRAFPVVIDPQIKLSNVSEMTTYSWSDGYLYNSSLHRVGTGEDRVSTSQLPDRMYMNFNVPTLPRNPRIKKAELKIFQKCAVCDSGKYPKIGLYQVDDEITTGLCTPYNNSHLIDYAQVRPNTCGEEDIVSYTFDVTTLVDRIDKGESDNSKLVLKMIDERYEGTNYICLYGSASEVEYAPQFVITYESSYGVNTSYRTHSHELGRFGEGSIDLQCGNLMFESEDFTWAGNRMPVTIKHLYNTALYNYQYTTNNYIKLNTADFSAMKLGYGYKLNIMQSMISANFQHEGKQYIGYAYIGENGEEVFFRESDKQTVCESGSHCYHLYEDINGGDMLYDPERRTLKQGEETYKFDSVGRLIQIKDAAGNHMDITYTSNRITSVTDGAGRDFTFVYSGNGFLTSITAPDETSVIYTYSGNLLSTIKYQDGRKVALTYSSNKPTAVTLLDANGNNVYRVAYSYVGDRVYSVTEYGVENGNFVTGAKSTYSYSAASSRTIVQTTELMDEECDSCENVIKTVYTFDDDGNIISDYVYTEDIGNVAVEDGGSGINPYSGENGVGIIANADNLLKEHNFATLNYWQCVGCVDKTEVRTFLHQDISKFGRTSLTIYSLNNDAFEMGVTQETITLPAGEYTFSAYARLWWYYHGREKAGLYLRVTDINGNILSESERLCDQDSEYVRFAAPFTLHSEQKVIVKILADGAGISYIDGAQLEKNPYASGYNYITNGNFEQDSFGWNSLGTTGTSSEKKFNMSRSMRLTGSLSDKTQVYQNISLKHSKEIRETFLLSGWAKGNGLSVHQREGADEPVFGLMGRIYYSDTVAGKNNFEDFFASFAPDTDEWQYASVEIAKTQFRQVDRICIYCEYSNNREGYAYFDNIQLIRQSIEKELSAEDFVTESEDNAGSEVSVEQNKLPTQGGTETTESEFEEAVDKYGNKLTETTFTDGEFGTIYRAFGFTSDCNCPDNAGNDLICEIDARKNMVYYTVDEDTSRNKEVIDRCSNKTAYEYDESGRTTKVTNIAAQRDENGKVMRDANGNVLYETTPEATVSYAYDAFDNMTEIVRGDGMKYVLDYNAYHNLESIGIHGKNEKLVKYTYKNGNGRLKQITYANGNTMKAFYNGSGQMVAEKWYSDENCQNLTQHYKYVYDGQGNIVRSIDISGEKEYNYEYDNGKIVRAIENNIEVNDSEMIVSRARAIAIHYSYDNEDQLVKKTVIPEYSAIQRYSYEYPENSNAVTTFTIDGTKVTSHSKNDSFGRKEFDELQIGTGFISRQFHYHAGEVTDEHRDNAKLKSSPTTQLVSQIVLSGGRAISYEYDEEERIKTVIDSVDGTTEYTYDALGQLVTETSGGVTTKFEYDNYGNITAKGEVDETGEIAPATKNSYVYGNGAWKDLLTAYNGQPITYDAQGNPTNYLDHTLTWEKGRQLKSFDNIAYTYNANGIRTSKTVDGIKHTYTLDGTKILRETWGNNTLIPLYDNEDSICGIIYNNEPFYFQKNLQGDIIGIVDKNADVIAKYSYDAWGACTIKQDTTSVGIATINPFRYRGYYYDEEIQLYYLQSRYYDACVGRFINIDDLLMITIEDGTIFNNLFSYCNNEPIKNIDSTGKVAIFITMAIGAIFGLAIQWVIDMVTNVIKGSKKFYKPCSSCWDYICSAASGALAATGIGKMAAMFSSAIIGTINYVLNCASRKAKTSRLELILTFIIGLICGYIGGSGANLKRINGVVKSSKTILKTAVSAKKIAMYTAKIKNAIVSTVVNAIRYVVSAVANSLGSSGRKYVKGLLGC